MFNKKSIIIVIAAIVAIIVVCYIKHWHIENTIAKHDNKIETVIKSIVTENIRNEYPALYLPHITMDTLIVKSVDADSISISKLFGADLEGIESKITKYFCDYYANQDSICKSKSSIPFIIYPSEKDNNGNIVLQPKDLNNIKRHIEYLTTEVDKAVSDIKEELGHDIERLNLWTSIWIGILSLFGTIIPLFFQYQTQSKFKEIKSNIQAQEKSLLDTEKEIRKEFRDQFGSFDEKVIEATNKANSAINNSEKVVNELSKVENQTIFQEKKINQFSQTLDSLQKELFAKEESISLLQENVQNYNDQLISVKRISSIAKAKSDTAIKSSRELKSIVYLSNSLGNLKQMDFYKVHLYGNKMEAYLSIVFLKIKDSLTEYQTEYNSDFNDLFNGLIGDMILSFRQMRGFLKERTQLETIDLLERSLTELLTMSDDNKDSIFAKVDSNFNDLINSLKNDSQRS